jgi:hypothetical protein
MTRALLSAALLFFSLAFSAQPARADLPPGPPPPADDCTLDKQCKDGQTCPTLGGEVDKDCAAGMAKSGLALNCVQKRATVGKAVYCPAAKKGCGKSSVAPLETGGGTTALGLIAAGLAVAALRRARSRRSPRR